MGHEEVVVVLGAGEAEVVGATAPLVAFAFAPAAPLEFVCGVVDACVAPEEEAGVPAAAAGAVDEAGGSSSDSGAASASSSA